jgi:hypothetical protein
MPKPLVKMVVCSIRLGRGLILSFLRRGPVNRGIMFQTARGDAKGPSLASPAARRPLDWGFYGQPRPPFILPSGDIAAP